MSIRDRAVALVRTFEGFSGDPQSPTFDNYLGVIAFGESPQAQIDMSRMSGCALLVRGLWRLLGHPDPRLSAPYKTQHAVSDVVGTAQSYGAYQEGFHRPCPGDVVHVGGDGTGPEHVWTCLEVQDNPYDDSLIILGADGGQRDSLHFECVQILSHEFGAGKDHSIHATDLGGGYHRTVRGVICLDRLFQG